MKKLAIGRILITGMHSLKSLYKREIMNQFVKYIFVAGLATLVDWGSFYALIHTKLYYQFCLIISFTLGSVTHYTLNKTFTFKNRSKKIVNQFGTFIAITIVYLFLSMGIMYILVELLDILEMQSKIMTTFILVCFSFTAHKFITFNKRYFGD